MAKHSSQGTNQRGPSTSKPKNPSHLAQSTAIDSTESTPEPQDPLSFDTLSLESLRKYRELHKIPVRSPYSSAGFLLDCKVGRKTYSFKHHHRTTKWDVAAACKRHFMAHNIRETDVLVDFIYSVKNQDRAFKLHF